MRINERKFISTSAPSQRGGQRSSSSSSSAVVHRPGRALPAGVSGSAQPTGTCTSCRGRLERLFSDKKRLRTGSGRVTATLAALAEWSRGPLRPPRALHGTPDGTNATQSARLGPAPAPGCLLTPLDRPRQLRWGQQPRSPGLALTRGEKF